MHIRVFKDGNTTYPYSPYQLRIDTGAMFEQTISDDVLAHYGVFEVAETPQPVWNPLLETIDELPPVQDADGKWSRVWKVRQLYTTTAKRNAVMAAELARVQGALSEQIDIAVATASAKPQRFIKEYERREAQARAFAAAGFTGEAPALIAGFAQSAGLTGEAAAKLTIAQADDLYNKLDTLANLRMRKYEVKRTTSIDAAQAAGQTVLAEIAKVAATIT